MVAATPFIENGSGTLLAAWAAGASSDPKTLKVMPGAEATTKEAPLVSPPMERTVPAEREADCTVTLTDPVTLPKVATIVPEPCDSCEPVTTRVAVAVPAEPTRFAEPKELPAMENDTAPAGVLPVVSVTVAIRYTVSVTPAGFRLLITEMLCVSTGGTILPPLQATARLYASTEPSPAA